jgi:hypothetical protein
VKGLILEERGVAALFAVLIMIPLLLAVISGSSGLVASVTGTDVDMQEAVAFACKSAAASVHPAAQARGCVRIDSALAHATFRDILARNMGLSADTLDPLPDSLYASRPRYWLVVYNGYDDYASSGAFGARFYHFNGSAVSEGSLPYNGFPAFFAVSETGIVSGSGGTFTVRLDSPGVVALVESEAKRVIGKEPIRAQRWAAARVIWDPESE